MTEKYTPTIVTVIGDDCVNLLKAIVQARFLKFSSNWG
jgi:hypothetical protein